MSPRPARRAVVVGIDYPGTPYALSGCVNDARAWAAYLVAKRFDVVMLTDADATRNGILHALRAMLDAAEPGAACWFVYSGHGTTVRDLDGDEADGRDEALCPFDFASGQLLIDDDLRALFDRGLKAGVSLTVVADSCHSGTVARLMAHPQRRAPKGGAPRYIGASRQMDEAHATYRRHIVSDAPRGTRLRWVTLSACHATEVAYESDGAGHFTTHALSVLKGAGTTLSRSGFMRRVLASFGEDRAQTPQIDAPAYAEKRAMFAGSVAK